MLFSEIIGMPVLSPAGTSLGYVTDARFARGYLKLSCLICADGDEEEFYLPLRAVRALNDAVIAGGARLPSPTGLPAHVGLSAYSEAGVSLGRVADVRFSEEGAFFVLEREGERREIPVALAAAGETLIVYEKPVKRPPKKTKAEPKQKIKAPEPPVRIDLGRCDLLGRRVKKSVYDPFGVPIVLAGERITPAVLSAARRSNRLLELTVKTLTTV